MPDRPIHAKSLEAYRNEIRAIFGKIPFLQKEPKLADMEPLDWGILNPDILKGSGCIDVNALNPEDQCIYVKVDQQRIAVWCGGTAIEPEPEPEPTPTPPPSTPTKTVIPRLVLAYGLLSATGDKNFQRTRFVVPVSKYPAGTKFFIELNGCFNTDSSDREIRVIESTGGAALATVTVPANSGDSNNNIRVAPVEWTPVDGGTYEFELEGTATASQLGLNIAHLNAVVDGPGSSWAWYPLCGRDGGSGGDSILQYTLQATSGSYLPAGGSSQYVFHRDDSKFGAGVSYGMEVLGNSNSLSKDADFALRRLSTGAIVASSVVSIGPAGIFTTAGATLDPSDTDWVDGEDYEFTMKNPGIASAQCFQAWLIPQAPGPKLRSWHLLSHAEDGFVGDEKEFGRFYWQASDYNSVSRSFIAAGKETAAGDIQVGLGDDGTGDGPGSSASTVAGSLQTLTSSKTVQESGALTLTDGNRYVAKSTRTDSSTVEAACFIAVDVE